MELRSSTRGHALVDHFLVQSVSESVAGRRGPIRPSFQTVGLQKSMATHQAGASLFDLLDVDLHANRDERRRELHPRDARNLQQPSQLAIESIDLPVDELPEVLRYPGRDLLGSARQGPASLHFDEGTTPDGIVEHVDDEQRIAFCPRVDRSCQPPERQLLAGGRKAAYHELLHRVFGQQPKWKL